MTVEPPVKVSVIIPCFNASAWIAETVESVVAQTLRELEVVFVEDGSTDDTRSVILRLIAQYSDRAMRLLVQDDVGLAAARNHGISAARGRYILPLDADDQIAPTMLEACARVLDDRPDTAIVFTDRQDFGELHGVHAAGHFALARLKYFNQISYCSLYRRDVWAAVGGYRVNVTGFDDWDFWVAAAARRFRGHHLPQPLHRHRRRGGSFLMRIADDYERLFATIILNNREVYSETEVAAASRYLSSGERAGLLQWSKRIFLERFPLPREAS
jgi:glycosyltransferase involved in cell wall biosynthesis